ncbi:hypothetical protein CC78DRAFT_577025 [Lojkania enalia]|uniref:Uncharacterized protein n=1 Tax=Lojkania enalia TaxID=147567 RepID=A0A9P4N6L4_9PLEO|nr:hypothetical protein CC78DRAFT_577025 [Didymosphaeria enalia]
MVEQACLAQDGNLPHDSHIDREAAISSAAWFCDENPQKLRHHWLPAGGAMVEDDWWAALSSSTPNRGRATAAERIAALDSGVVQQQAAARDGDGSFDMMGTDVRSRSRTEAACRLDAHAGVHVCCQIMGRPNIQSRMYVHAPMLPAEWSPSGVRSRAREYIGKPNPAPPSLAAVYSVLPALTAVLCCVFVTVFLKSLAERGHPHYTTLHYTTPHHTIAAPPARDIATFTLREICGAESRTATSAFTTHGGHPYHTSTTGPPRSTREYTLGPR